MQVFTRDGWLWVNPYITLISAYERLIRGRGREIGPEPAPLAAVAHALPEDVVRYRAATKAARTNRYEAAALTSFYRSGGVR